MFVSRSTQTQYLYIHIIRVVADCKGLNESLEALIGSSAVQL